MGLRDKSDFLNNFDNGEDNVHDAPGLKVSGDYRVDRTLNRVLAVSKIAAAILAILTTTIFLAIWKFAILATIVAGHSSDIERLETHIDKVDEDQRNFERQELIRRNTESE